MFCFLLHKTLYLLCLGVAQSSSSFLLQRADPHERGYLAESSFADIWKANNMIGSLRREPISIDSPYFSRIDNDTNTTYLKWPAFPIGNAFFVYWESRASAACRNQSFAVQEVSHNVILDHFPQRVNAPNADNEMVEKCIAARTSGGYPQLVANARWRLIAEQIQEETKDVSDNLCKLHAGAADPQNTVAIHIRCDDYIQTYHNEYGLLPHRYFEKWIPADLHQVVIVGKSDTVGVPRGHDAPKCKKAVWDLKEYLEMRRPDVNVVLGSGSKDEVGDWCFLSKAKRLVLTPSTFSVCAAFGNPNTVVYPAVVPALIPTNAKSLAKWGASPFPSNVIVDDAELLGGRTIANLSWPDIRRWLRT